MGRGEKEGSKVCQGENSGVREILIMRGKVSGENKRRRKGEVGRMGGGEKRKGAKIIGSEGKVRLRTRYDKR